MAIGAVKAPRAGNKDGVFQAINIAGAVSQKVAYTATAAQSTALAAGCKMIRVIATTNAFIKIGADPTAVATGVDVYLALGQVYFFDVDGGEKVSAIRDSGDGNLFITEAVSI
jgi:hypothetical protein